LPLFKELKRRNVFKVGIAYTVMAWLVMQVADVILNNIEAPNWVFHVVLLLLGVGFLLTMFFAWAFEITPEGIKREHEVDRSQSITPQTGKKLNNLILVVMAVAITYFAYDKFILSANREAALVEATTQALAEQAAIDEAAVQSDNSIAVLPFVNMSSDEEQEYFSDGLSEELLNLLVKIPELRVTSRSSAFSYKGKDFKITDVGRELNVAHVLEGSVRKSGNQIRITAQLIQVSTDTHLWSQTYDRSLDNVFAIQDEIASEVVAQLKITLLGDAPLVRETDPQAYALYLQGRHLNRKKTPEGYEQAQSLLYQALAIDPDYAEAWIELAYLYTFQAGVGLKSSDEGYTLAREATDKALAIDPNYALAHASLGWIAEGLDNDLAAAARHYERALQLDPANTYIIRVAAILTADLGRLDEAIALSEFLVSRDPVNPASLSLLGTNYGYAGRWDDAIASFYTALRLNPGYSNTQYNIGKMLLLKGEPQAALEAMKLEDSVWGMIGLAMVYHSLGRQEDSDATLAALIEQYEQDWAFNIAYVLAYRGEADRAFEWLEKAVARKDTGLSEIVIEPLFANIHDDPRWQPFLESTGNSQEQLDAIEFTVTLPN